MVHLHKVHCQKIPRFLLLEPVENPNPLSHHSQKFLKVGVTGCLVVPIASFLGKVVGGEAFAKFAFQASRINKLTFQVRAQKPTQHHSVNRAHRIGKGEVGHTTTFARLREQFKDGGQGVVTGQINIQLLVLVKTVKIKHPVAAGIGSGIK